MKAVEKGNIEMVRLLMDNGADISAADEVHTTPIIRVVEDGAEMIMGHNIRYRNVILCVNSVSSMGAQH